MYLMEHADKGFRIGRTMSVRQRRSGQPDLGPRVRLNQEHGDRLWILGLYADASTAAWWESWFSAQYGLPTACFHDSGRRLAMDQDDLDRLFASIDTRSRAKDLLEDLDLHLDSGTSTSPKTVCAVRPSTSRCSATIATARSATTASSGRRTARMSPIGWRLPRSASAREARRDLPRRDRPQSYPEALEMAKRMAHAGGLHIRRRANVAGQIWDFMPLSHLRPGMTMLQADDDGGLSPVTVEAVEIGEYSGPVYDLKR